MASWKKVLVSGSSIEVNEITASGVPTLDNESNLLAIDATTGGITQITQAQVNAGNQFSIGGEDSGSLREITNTSFTSSTDYTLYKEAHDDGFGFEITELNNTHSIALQTPQPLKTTSSPIFKDLYVKDVIYAEDDENTKISFEINDKILFQAGGRSFLSLHNTTQDVVVINPDDLDIDFRVEGTENEYMLFVDATSEQVLIGTPTTANSLLTVDGGVAAKALTASAMPSNDSSTTVIVDAGGGRFETRDINDLTGDGSGLFDSGSIIGTTNEIEVTFEGGDITTNTQTQIGLPDDVTIGNRLHVSGAISASGGITASNIQLDGDLALGGNIFSFEGFSFIEGVSAVFTSSNVFGSGSDPADNDTAGGGVAHTFTGSVAITGSGLTIVGGGVTAVDQSSTFAGTLSTNITASGTISASGNLFAGLDEVSTNYISMYEPTTGLFSYTASDAFDITSYDELVDVPTDILSGSVLSSPGQGDVILTNNGLAGATVDLGLQTTDDVVFNNLTLTGSANITGSITASGEIYGESHLFASLSLDDTQTHKVVVYDEATHQFFHTGSYGGGGGGGGADFETNLDNIPEGLISGSDQIVLKSDVQGEAYLTIGGVDSSAVDLGLQTTDDVIFNDVVVDGNLTVNGATTTISTQNLTIEDRFIALAVGAGADTTAGFIVERAGDGTGTALIWDASTDMWSIDINGADPDAGDYGSVAADIKIVTVAQDTTAASTYTSGYGNSDNNRRGQFYINTDEAFGLYVWLDGDE